jgi:hypothetical protein
MHVKPNETFTFYYRNNIRLSSSLCEIIILQLTSALEVRIPAIKHTGRTVPAASCHIVLCVVSNVNK